MKTQISNIKKFFYFEKSIFKNLESILLCNNIIEPTKKKDKKNKKIRF